MKKLSKQNIIDILYGCTILGTGGGGNLEDGLAMMEQDFAEGKELYLADLSELPDDKYIATPYGCGAPAALNAEKDAKFANLPISDVPPAILAFRSLENYFGEKFFAVSSTELAVQTPPRHYILPANWDCPSWTLTLRVVLYQNCNILPILYTTNPFTPWQLPQNLVMSH